jgi:hypothetical protein
MSTRIWSFLPKDVSYVPAKPLIEQSLDWLRTAMPAYKVEAIDHVKIAFFDCGGNMGATFCPHYKTELSASGWSDWMTEDYDEANGFQFSKRNMQCCGVSVSLDAIVFENPCMFGRFGIAVTDTMKTYSETEIDNFADELAKRLQCPIRYLEAHY